MDEKNNKDSKEKEEEKKDQPTEETKKPDPPEPPKPKKKPELPPIKLTKSQTKLYTTKMVEHEAMKNQVAGVINQLGNEIRRGLAESFAEELGIDLSARKYEFDRETLTFIDFNILRERARMQQGMPRMQIPGHKDN